MIKDKKVKKSSYKEKKMTKKPTEKKESLEESMEVDSVPNKRPKLQSLNKAEERQKQKETRVERRKAAKGSNEIFEMGQKAKKIWEQVRRSDCKTESKVALLTQLHDDIKGSVCNLIFAHDTVRVVECLMALGSENIRQSLYEELKTDIIPIMKSKYASFFAIKLIKYGSKEQRASLVSSLQGRIPELMKHKIANSVVEIFYNEHSNAIQRNRMLQEFCGPEFRLFKEDSIRSVPELIEKHPLKRKDICHHLFENSSTLISKGCYNHSLVHTVLYNCIRVVDESKKGELINSLVDACVHILHSHDGSRLAMHCLWFGSVKNRKSILKSFKTFIPKIATEEHGHFVLLALFDCVDDTKFVFKVILSEFMTNLEEIMKSKYGQKVLTYIFAPRNTKYFHPQVIDLLKIGDGNSTSKKDQDVRWRELAESISPATSEYFIKKIRSLLLNNSSTIVLTAVLNYLKSDPSKLLEALSREATQPFYPDDASTNIVELTATHHLLKKVIAHDTIRNAETLPTFSLIALQTMSVDSVESWIKSNRGCFLFVLMVELKIPQISKALLDSIKPLMNTLNQQSSQGATILKEKLKSL